jgi:hypothetical protein
MGNIDITITAMNRPDLLIQTLGSFLQFADLPLGNIYVHEDSGIEGVNDSVKKVFPEVIFIEPKERQGQIKAIDSLMNRVQTPYVACLEEDWLFDRTGFMALSLDILESVSNISEVWLRYPNERNNHPAHGIRRKTPKGTKYQMLATGYRKVWHGTSFGPTLRRLSDYQLIGPYSEITTFDPANPLKSEIEVGQAYFKKGFRAATLLTGYCRHIGQNRHCK